MSFIRKKVVFLISHKPDIRYIKRFNLMSKMFDLTVIYCNKTKISGGFCYKDIEVNEIMIPANQTNPMKRIPQTIKFSRASFKILNSLNADIVYAGNLDMLMVATKYNKKNKKARIVYEIADLHRLIVDKQKNFIKRIVSWFLKRKEKQLCKKVDLLVLTSMKFYDVYYKNLIDKEKVAFVPNIPNCADFNGFEKKKHDGFVIAFVGSVRYKQQLSMLIDAAKKCGVKALIAGKDSEGETFKNKYFGCDYVDFIGEFDYKERIKDIYSSVDCIYSVYDADMFNVRVALPNKLYESVFTGIPIIVAKNTYLFELVDSLNIGFGVSHRDLNDLIQTIELIKSKGKEYVEKCLSCVKARDTLLSTDYDAIFLNKLMQI